MSIHRYRLRAFTIIETMVALVLTGLIISFVYTGIRFIRQHSVRLTSQFDTFGEFTRLQRALQWDTEHAAEMGYRTDEMNFAIGDRAIRYVITDSLCIRHKDMAIDTFRIRVDSVASWFDGARLGGIGEQVADQATFYVRIQKRPMPININKRYDAATLMRITPAVENE